MPKRSPSPKTVLVTVGTTTFPDLLTAVSHQDLLEQLATHHFTHLVLQTGSTPYAAPTHPSLSIRHFDYTADLSSELAAADLVISHAGAGTLLQALRLHKAVLVVVNEGLMDNHQAELADALATTGHVWTTRCQDFSETLRSLLTATDAPRPFPVQQRHLFSTILTRTLAGKRE
jgi:beta-1,4-N-acetylglucosaminyltransferase